MPEPALAPEVGIVTDGGRRRRWTAAGKPRIEAPHRSSASEETLDGRDSLSGVARRRGVGASLPHHRRRPAFEGGSVAVADDDAATIHRVVRRWTSASARSGAGSGASLAARPWRWSPSRRRSTGRAQRTDGARAVAAEGRLPVSVVAKALGVSRPQPHARLAGRAEPRRRHRKARGTRP